ncbi:MAG: glycosyltransferase [Candidatus Sericytochromatia bacterium]
MLNYKGKKLLLIGYFSLDKLDSAPKVRTYNIHKGFCNIIDTDFITGDRNSRKIPLLKYIFTGKIFDVDAIYVEAGPRTSTEVDIFFLLFAKFIGKPIGLYIRDAYPLFKKDKKKNLKEIISDWGWFVSIWFYKFTASILFFPTEKLKKLFTGIKKYDLLPPAGKQIEYIPFSNDKKGILYCGALGFTYSPDILLKAVEKVYLENKDIELYFICREDELTQELKVMINNKPWIKVMHTDFEEIVKIREKIYLCMIPLSESTYSDLAIPVKTLDYMSIGRPIIATEKEELSNFFRENEIGLICKTNIDDMADKISFLLNNEKIAKEMSKNTHKVLLEKNLWEHRAKKVLSYLI